MQNFPALCSGHISWRAAPEAENSTAAGGRARQSGCGARGLTQAVATEVRYSLS